MSKTLQVLVAFEVSTSGTSLHLSLAKTESASLFAFCFTSKENGNYSTGITFSMKKDLSALFNSSEIWDSIYYKCYPSTTQ